MNVLLKNKLYNVLAVSRLLNSLGAYIYNVVFVIYAATQFQSTWAVSVANIIMVVPTIFTFFVGVQADKTKKKARALITTSFVQALLFLGMSFLLRSATVGTFALVCMINVLSDLLTDYSSGLRLPILQKNLQEEELMEAYSFFQFITCISGLGGQALGVWLLASTDNNFGLVAVLNALFFLVSGLLLFFKKSYLTHDVPATVPAQSLKQQFDDVVSNVKAIFEEDNSGNFVATLSGILMMNALGGAIGAIYTVYFLQHSLFQLTYAQSLLLVNAVLVVCMIFGSLTPNDAIARLPITKMMLVNALTLVGIGVSGLLGLHAIVGIGLLGFASYIGGKVNPKIDALLLANTSPELLARTNNLLTMLFTLSLPVGTILFSSLATVHMGLTWAVFVIVGLVAAVLAKTAQAPAREDDKQSLSAVNTVS